MATCVPETHTSTETDTVTEAPTCEVTRQLSSLSRSTAQSGQAGKRYILGAHGKAKDKGRPGKCRDLSEMLGRGFKPGGPTE